ncbi:putative peptide-modifying radical SAM/SPASM domain-containing protein, partial [Euryarchaeota archaeon ex4484_162]
APEYKWNVLGDLKKGFEKIEIQKPCLTCDVYDVCGGRCLFFNRELLWGRVGFNYVCDLTKFLIKELKENKSFFVKLKEKINYPAFNNTTEIIP